MSIMNIIFIVFLIGLSIGALTGIILFATFGQDKPKACWQLMEQNAIAITKPDDMNNVNGLWRCSKCGHKTDRYTFRNELTDYCPECGAKMAKVKKD